MPRHTATIIAAMLLLALVGPRALHADDMPTHTEEPPPVYAHTGLVEIGFPFSTVGYTFTPWDHLSIGAAFRTNLLASSLFGATLAVHLLPPRTLGVDAGLRVTVGAATRDFDEFPLVVAPEAYVQWAAFDELLILGLEIEYIATIPNPGDSAWAYPKLVQLYLEHKFAPKLYGRIATGFLHAQSARKLSCEGAWDYLLGPRPTDDCSNDGAVYDVSFSATVGLEFVF